MTHARRVLPPGRQHGAVGRCGVAVDGVAAAHPQGAAGRGRPSRCGGQGIPASPAVAGGLQGHVSTKVLTVLLGVAGGPGRGFGLEGQPLRRARRARGRQPKVLRGAEGWHHCQRPDTVRPSSCLCSACAACAAVLTQHQAWSDGRCLLQGAAGVAGARRCACWAWRRRCWA